MQKVRLMITNIKISGYKSIKELNLDLEPVNILLGSNGAGKSNFISIFSLIKNIYNQNLQNYIQKKGGVDSFLHFGQKNTSNINIELQFVSDNDAENIFSIDLELGQSCLFIKETKTAFKWGDWREQKHETNVTESNFRNINRRQAYWVNDRLKEFNVFHFHDTSDTSPMKMMADLHDNDYLRPDGANLAAFLFFLQEKEPKTFKRIELTIKSIAPFFSHFVLKPNRLNEQKIQLEWTEKNFTDSYFTAHHLSDGTLRFICLATLLMQPNPPKTIIIDEPELGLHPVAVNKLAALIRKVSSNSQIILSTQSINFIDQFSPKDIIITDRGTTSSLFKRLNEEELAEWLEEYTLGDLWGKNKLGGQPYQI